MIITNITDQVDLLVLFLIYIDREKDIPLSRFILFER